jgi:hypothetical protein
MSVNYRFCLSTFIAVFLTCSYISRANASCVSNPNNPEYNVFGLSMTSSHEQEAQELLSELGVEWVRSEFHWSIIEETPGVYNWNQYDRFMLEMERRNIQVQAIVSYVPKWIKTESQLYSHFTAFMDAFIQRYKPNGLLAKNQMWDDFGLRYIEVFNEPNYTGFGWGNKGDDASKLLPYYVDLLKLANESVRRYSPESFILLGGLSPDGMPPQKFLEMLYQYDVNACFDIFAFHPYGNIEKLQIIKSSWNEFLVSRGFETKPIWFNEFGTTENRDRVHLINEVFSRQDEWDAFFWFSLRDLKRWGWNFGLVEYSWSRKEGFEEMKKHIQSYKSNR